MSHKPHSVDEVKFGLPATGRSRGRHFSGELVWQGCRHCGDDVLAPEDADSVTCGRCSQAGTARGP